MKVFSMSQRIYYKDLEPDAESIIKKDLELYNCMLHKAFKICFDRAYKDVTYSETDQRMIKSFYGTSDYFPLSAIYEAKALVKSLKCLEKENQDMIKTRLKKINKKIKTKENQLKKALKEKEKLINRSKKKKYTEEDYLYEVQVLDPNIKRLKSIIRNLKFKKNRNEFKLKRKMPSVCFGGKKNLKCRSQNILSKEDWKQNRLLPIISIVTADYYGNRKFAVDIIDNNQIILKINRHQHVPITLPKLRKNVKNIYK